MILLDEAIRKSDLYNDYWYSRPPRVQAGLPHPTAMPNDSVKMQIRTAIMREEMDREMGEIDAVDEIDRLVESMLRNTKAR